MNAKEIIIDIVDGLMSRREQRPEGISIDSELYAQGLALDSLELAELSATLESRLGRDPFTDGELPQTIADIVRYYEATS